MEIYVLELKKLPPEDQNEEGLLKWLRFIKAKNKEELRKMADQDEYIEDEEKRLEYETRLKNRRDKHAALHYATRIGREEGENRINKLILCLTEQGRVEDLVRAASDTSYQKKLLKEFGL